MLWRPYAAVLLLECVAVAAVTGAGWFGILLLVDRHHREKGSARELLISLVVGFASVPAALLLYTVTPDALWNAGSPALQQVAFQILVVGPAEELSKFLVFLLVMAWRKPAHEPMDAILHAAAVALSFSLVENVMYGLDLGVEVTALRGIVSSPLHMSLAAVWGFAYAALVLGNPRRSPRDYAVLFLSVYPAALLHGVSNLLIGVVGQWSLLGDLFFFAGSVGLLAWLRRRSPFLPLSLARSSEQMARMEAALSANPRSRPLALRAAVAALAIGDYRRGRRAIDQCLGGTPAALPVAISGVLAFLEGRTEYGERQLRRAWPRLAVRHQRLIERLVLHVERSRGTENAYNEFLLRAWLRERRYRPLA